MRNVWLLVFSFIVVHLNAHEAVIKIFDEQSKKPVFAASVCFEAIGYGAKSYATSDMAGTLANPVKKRSVIAISCIGYVTLLDTIVSGQSYTFYLQPTAYAVNEVVVKGQFTPLVADQSIYRVDVISNRQIIDKGANNLAELLANELGMRTLQDASLGTNLSIQGISGEHVKILIDGVPVIGRQNGILDLTQISLSNVDHLEVVEGPMSVIYGSNALAGAVNIITKEPINGSYIAKVNTYFESVGIYNFDGNVAYRNSKHIFNLSGGRNFFGGYSVLDTSRAQTWKPKMQYFGNLDYVLTNNKSKLRLTTSYFRELLLNKGVPDLAYNDVLNQFHYTALDEYHYTTRWDLKEDYTLTVSPEKQLQVLSAYSYYNKTKKTTVKDLVDLSEIEAAPSLQDTTKFNDIMSKATFGDNSKAIINYQTGVEAYIETGTGKRLNGKKQIDNYAGFLVANILPKQKFTTQAGLRYTYNTKFKAPLVYSLNFKYSPLSDLVFRASYGKGFRSPDLKELYLDFIDINHDITGNDQLKSEYSNNYTISGISSFKFDKNSITLDAMLFYNTFKNKIELLNTNAETNAYTYYNITNGNYITKGAEVKLQYQFHPRFSFNAGMNFLGRSRISNLDSFYYSTDYTLNFNYKSLRYLFRLSAYYKYTDSWYDSQAQYNANHVITNILPSYIKGYHTLDITLSRPFFKNTLEIATGLKNLFNNKNVFSYGSSSDNPHSSFGSGNTPIGWGRTYFIRLSYNFLKF